MAKWEIDWRPSGASHPMGPPVIITINDKRYIRLLIERLLGSSVAPQPVDARGREVRFESDLGMVIVGRDCLE